MTCGLEYIFFIVLSFFSVLNVLKVPKVPKVLKVPKVFSDLKVFVSLFQNLLSVHDIDALLHLADALTCEVVGWAIDH